MVQKCAFHGCPNRRKPVRLRKRAVPTTDERLSFHTFPVNDPQRLQLWLLSVQRYVDLPLGNVSQMRLCSEHFSPDDFKPGQGKIRRKLKSTAVPSLCLLNTKETPNYPSPLSQDPQSEGPYLFQDAQSEGPYKVSQDPQTECPAQDSQSAATLPTSQLPVVTEKGGNTEEFSTACLSGVPQSTPVKPYHSQSSMQEPQDSVSKLQLVLFTPESAKDHSHPSTSGTYDALPVIKSYQSDEQTLAENPSEDLTMLSLDPPSDKKDLSFVPLSSTSTSTSSTEEDEANVTYKERKWMVNESNLMELFSRCHLCGASATDIKKTTFGSLIRVHWECINGHEGTWKSCNETRGMPDNNLLVAASTLFTGATYVDIADWAACLNLQVPKKTTFYAIQSSYLIPVVDVVYKEQQAKLMEDLRMQNILQKGVHLSGDGRSDSPEFSAKYCTYSLMDDSNNQVVHFELVQVIEASSSVAMEPIGFKRGVNFLLENGIDIEVMTTDRSPSIRKTMRVDYPHIHHEFDIWHVVKGFFKKLLSISRKRENQDLLPWIKSICNHLWYACASSSGNPQVLTEKWKSLLHHICGVHSWREDGQQHRCDHDDLSPDQQRRKRWLQKESPAFRTLSSLVLNPSLLKDLRQMALFKHTGSLEVYHSVFMKYCRKNLHFHYSSMAARTQLAVLDHNENVHRQQATTSSGVPRYNVVFPKHSKEWVAKNIYEPSSQNFRDGLLLKVLERHSDPTVVFKDPTSQVALPDLPCNIATKPKLDKEAAITKHASRFRE